MEERARRKLTQLLKEFEGVKLDWHSIAHLALDLSTVSVALEEHIKHAK